MYGLVLYDPIYCTVGRVSWAGFKEPVKLSGGSIPWGGGGRSSNPDIRGGLKKIFFRASVWSKKKGEAQAPQAPPLDTPLKLTVFELYLLLGMYDMLGNAWEWVSDEFKDQGKEAKFVLRGGSYIDSADGKHNHKVTVNTR